MPELDYKEAAQQWLQKAHKATLLSSYYITTRYPDYLGFQEYTKKQAQEAFEIAKRIVKVIEGKLVD